MTGNQEPSRLMPVLVIVIGFVLVLLVWLLGYFTGEELSVSIFFLLPIVLVTWYSGRTAALVIAIISTITWYLADRWTGHVYSQEWISIWNMCVRLAFFLTVLLIFSHLKITLRSERELARTDPLTGVCNSREFYRVAREEFQKSRRFGLFLSIAYKDLDRFKQVKDRPGHESGAEVLRVVSKIFQENTRSTDTFAKMRGDEFVLLLPRTKVSAAVKVVTKLSDAFKDKMAKIWFGATLSVGIAGYA